MLDQVEKGLYIEIAHHFDIEDFIDEFYSFNFEVDAAVNRFALFVCQKGLQKLN